MGLPGHWVRASAALLVTLASLAPAQAATADKLGQSTEFSTGLNSGSFPYSIAPGPDGNVWFSDRGTTPAIGRITPQGQITEFQLAKGSFPEGGIVTGPDGNLWFTDQGCVTGPPGHSCAIGRITPQGAVTIFPLTTPAPDGITAGPDGNLWFTSGAYCPGATACSIGRITPQGTVTYFKTGVPQSDQPWGIAAGPDGNLWFTEQGSPPEIGRITPQGQVTLFSTGLGSSSIPYEIAPGPDGNMWFTDDASSTPAIGRITPQGQITEFSSGLVSGSSPDGIAAGPDGNLWFADHKEIGRITPQGQITEYSSGLQAGSYPVGIAPAADGNLWFTDEGSAVGRIGAGAPAALQSPPALSGPGRVGSPESCQNGQWATWAGVTASTTTFPFDGYQWLRDGVPIAGQTSSSYTPTPGDAGHQLTCAITVTYPNPFLVSSPSTSVAITVAPAPVPPAPVPPALSAFRVSPRSFVLAGRLVKGRCRVARDFNRRHRRCARPIALRVSFRLSMAATVTFTADRVLQGRLVGRRCKSVTRKNRKHPRCARVIAVRGSLVRTAGAGLDSFTWNARIAGRRLGRGSYFLIATPAATGRGGASNIARFQLRR